MRGVFPVRVGKAEMRQGTRRETLREATRDIHARLDDTVGELDDLSAYGAYLESTIRFRSEVETVLEEAAWPRDWTWRPVASRPHLLADAADLGIEPPAGRAFMARPTNVSALFGILYVVEGSSLGAKILRRRAARLGLGDAFGARHLAAIAEGGGWRSFVTLLEESAEFEPAHAIASASATFATALDCYEGGTRAAA